MSIAFHLNITKNSIIYQGEANLWTPVILIKNEHSSFQNNFAFDWQIEARYT